MAWSQPQFCVTKTGTGQFAELQWPRPRGGADHGSREALPSERPLYPHPIPKWRFSARFSATIKIIRGRKKLIRLIISSIFLVI